MASIRLDHVSVSFPIFDASSRSLKNRLISSATGGRVIAGPGNRISIVQALDDVSLAFDHGARVGLVGHNGAGKTTLLRVLSGIFEPNCGEVHVEGQAAPMFDKALGMDPESSGYENIVLRGLFLGMSRREIRERVDKIAEFSELGEFLDLPIRTYSDGMRTRLAFAVSTSIDPDILLLDEGIGAGDAAFLEKANKRLDSFIDKAAIIVLATHQGPLLKQMCTSAVLMEHGRVVKHGGTEEILDLYNQRKAEAQRR